MFLERIITQTRADLAQRKHELPLVEVQCLAAARPRPRDLLEALRHVKVAASSEGAGSPISLSGGQGLSGSLRHLIAEVKRASPSKGMLAPHLDPVELARTYEAHGAAAISVLTEPHFFLGSPDYLRTIKQVVNVPVLCKDFIVDEYQVYEARAWGADAILLICALLDDAQLRHLLNVAHTQRMHCLVEVHSREEAQRAVAAGAAIIGVNSRDLKTFQMNPHLIRELRQLIPADRVVVAESGIHNAADARRLARYDIQAMLVGESLVVSNDVPAQMRALLRGANEGMQVKICGLRSAEHLHAAIDAGADMLGLMFYEPSPRYIEPQQARALLDTFAYGDSVGADLSCPPPIYRLPANPPHGGINSLNSNIAPDVVGVFVNKDAAYINEIAEQVGLHIVQLHGDEPPEFCQSITRPVIKALRLRDMSDLGMVQAYQEVTWRILLDTPTHAWGGSGVTHDWSIARAVAQETPVLLAGGLTPENVVDAIQQVHPWGVDVSSGVETNGIKNVEKIRAFIENVRTRASQGKEQTLQGEMS
jgi:indole-3-glycerol phosphate synthase/phosphoribosylanthranilate isomerase